MPLRLIGFALLALVCGLHAVELRVATYNIGARYSGGSALYSLGDPGTPDFNTVQSVLDRIDADVVALQEIHDEDSDTEPTGTPEDIEILAANLGYPHVYIPSYTSLDFSLRVVIFSRFPFISTTGITSPSPANEVTRRMPAVRVDVPGTTRDPLIISAHLKSGTARVDRFRRAIEMRRLSNHLSAQATAQDNFVILGDFNLSSSNATFTELPADLPSSYRLGADIAFPVSYYTSPLPYFQSPVPVRLDPRQVNGSAVTYPTTSGGSTIDLFMVSPAIAARPYAAEIYNSALDTSSSIGLPKAGNPLASDTSTTASDHLAVFADLDLDFDYPKLAATVTPSTIAENSAEGTSTLTVTLPAVAAANVQITVSSADPAIAEPILGVITVPAGSLTASTGIRPHRNYIQDSGNTVSFTASASGYEPASVPLFIGNSEVPYAFTTQGQTLTEGFTGFDGTHAPFPWVTAGESEWRGNDTGASASTGFRSYGPAGDSSLGFLPNGQPASATASFANQSGAPITRLQIGYTAEQWRAINGGTIDQITAELLIGSTVIPLPELGFTAAVNLPTGAIAGGASSPRQTSIDGLAIAPGESFSLRFRFTPGSGSGPLADDVFVNEFHYDNAGGDTGEFFEIAVGPGFAGSLSDISLLLYNGSNGAVYGTHSLSTFTAGATTASGHRLFSKLISGIQNDVEGFAIVRGTEVVRFLSYEGAFAATDGAAAGMASTNIGVSQTGTEAVGMSSLGLAGTGGVASSFAWTKFAGAPTIGQTNTSQTFSTPVSPQGLAIDNISVTIGSGPAPDTDGDGFSDSIETTLTLTDPLDPNSRFEARSTYLPGVPGALRVQFPTLPGRKYTIETSTDLDEWDNGQAFSGNGSPRIVDLPVTPGETKRFHRVRIELE